MYIFMPIYLRTIQNEMVRFELVILTRPLSIEVSEVYSIFPCILLL